RPTSGNRPTARGHARCSPVRVAGPPAGHVQGPLAPTRFLGTLHLDSPDESGAHGGGDLAEDVGRYQPQLRGPGGARRPDVEDPLLEPLRGGVGRDILADDPVPLREQPSGGDLVVPAPLLGDLADELSEGLRIPRVGARTGPSALAQSPARPHRPGPTAADLFAFRTRPRPRLL